MKRQRESTLTREELEREEYGEEVPGQQQAANGNQRADLQTLSQRKIVKVKRHVQQSCSVVEEVPTQPNNQFKLAGSLTALQTSSSASTTAATSGAKPLFSFKPQEPVTAKALEKPEGDKPADGDKKADAGAKPNFFAVTAPTVFGGKEVKATVAPFAAKTATSGGLFGAQSADGGKKMFQVATGGTFGGKKLETKPEEEKPKETAAPTSLFGAQATTVKPLFGAPAAGASAAKPLFGNLQTVKEPEADATKKTGLFGAPVTFGADTGKKVGLFGAPSGSFGGGFAAAGDQKATTDDKPKAGGLFGTPASTTGSLFGNAVPPATGSLFGSKPPTGGSLFGAPPAGSGSIFGAGGSSLFGGAKPAAPKKDEGDGDGDNDNDSGAEEEGEKSPPAYASDLSKVEFKGGAQPVQQSPFQKIFEKHVGTFKIVKPAESQRKMTQCDLALEFAEQNGRKVFLIIVRVARKVLFQGQINSKVSRIRRVEEKSAKNQVKIQIQTTAETEVKAADGTKTKQKQITFPFCVVNLPRQEDMVTFETEFKKAIEELKKMENAQ